MNNYLTAYPSGTGPACRLLPLPSSPSRCSSRCPSRSRAARCSTSLPSRPALSVAPAPLHPARSPRRTAPERKRGSDGSCGGGREAGGAALRQRGTDLPFRNLTKVFGGGERDGPCGGRMRRAALVQLARRHKLFNLLLRQAVAGESGGVEAAARVQRARAFRVEPPTNFAALVGVAVFRKDRIDH